MHYTFPPTSPYRQLLLSADVIDKLSSMNEDEVKILLLIHGYALSQGDPVMEEAALLDYLSAKGYAPERAQNALAYLRGAQLLQEETGTKKKKQAPASERAYYTRDQLAEVSEASEEFKALRDYAEQKMQKLFNTADLSVLYSFMDSLCFSPAVIMLVIEYCISINKGSLRYVEKMLCDLSDKGITDYEAVERHIANIKEYRSYEGKIRQLCGFGDRALTKKEAAIVSRWKNELKADISMVELAYEKTVGTIQKPSLAYMGSILEQWAKDGIATPEQAANQGAPKEEKNKSFDTDDFFQAAVAKARGKK